MNAELLPYLGGVIAIFSSFFGAFASGGSALILMGILILITDDPYISLLATAKVAATAMVLMSSLLHRRRMQVSVSLIAVMTLSGLVGMALATGILQTYSNETLFEAVNGVLLIILAFYLFFSETKGQTHSGRVSFKSKELIEVGAVLLGFSFLNGFSGGMGLILSSYLVLRLRMSFIEATAYTMISGILVNASQAIYLVSTVEVNFPLLFFVVIGSLMGAYWGTKMQYLHGNRTVKWAVTCMMLILGVSSFIH